MSGPPLVEAVRCARHITDQLAPTDTASLVIFDDRVQTLVPARPVGDRKALYTWRWRTVIAAARPTCTAAGRPAPMSLLPGVGAAALARVILLSDGNANVGDITDTAGIAALCAQAAERGVTTSTYGLGRDFNEELMVEMAKRGGGNHYYGDTAADLFEPFAEEFDFISTLRPACPPVAGCGAGGQYPPAQRLSGRGRCRHSGDPPARHRLRGRSLGAGRTGDSGRTRCRGCRAPAAGRRYGSTPEGDRLPLPMRPWRCTPLPVSAWEALLHDPLVVARQAELAAGKLLEQARQAAEHGDWDTVERLLAEARQRFADQPWVIEVLASMAELARSMDTARFRKEALYSSRKMSSRLSAKEELMRCRLPRNQPRQLPAAQDGAGQGAVRQAGRFAEIVNPAG